MDLQRAYTDDVLSILTPGGLAKSVYRIVEAVGPLREAEVRAVIRSLVKDGRLGVVRGGGGWPAYYYRPTPSTPVWRRFGPSSSLSD